MRKHTTTLLSILAMSLCIFALAAETTTHPIETYAPKDSSRDVRIHFYIDAHKSMLPGDAYKRAANGLKIMLDDIANPIKKGLRDRMIGERVEINTGTAYLIKPKEITPFSLSGDSVLPKVKAESGKWDLNTLVDMIMRGPESESRNVVICVITNDPNLKTKHGVFRNIKDRGLMFFVLFAPKESVDGSLFHPYWDAKEWATFLRGEAGPTANDVANSIVDQYYNLSEKDVAGLESVVCEPTGCKIAIKRIHSLPEKDMWKSTFTINGKAVPREEDSAFVIPEVGQNKIVVSIESPTGIAYMRVWDGKDMTYFSLEADRNLLNDAEKALAEASKYDVMQGAFAVEIRNAVSKPNAPMTKEAMDAFREKVFEFQKKVQIGIGLKELTKKSVVAESLLSQIEPLDKKNAYLTNRQDVAKSLKSIKSLGEEAGLAAIETAKKTIDDAVTKLSDIKAALERAAEEERREIERKRVEMEIAANLEKGRKELLGTISNRVVEVKRQEETDKKVCRNISELDTFRDQAQNAKDSSELMKVNTAFGRWNPDMEAVDSPVTNVDERVGSNTPGRDGKSDPPPPPDPDPFMIFVVLVLIAGVGCIVWKMLLKPIACVSYEAAGSTDGAVSVEARKKQVVRLDESLGCQIDVRVICQKNESGSMDFVVTSPNKGVWLQKLGGDNKKPVAETGMPFEEGKYQLFDNEFAMSAVGTIEFESKIN